MGDHHELADDRVTGWVVGLALLALVIGSIVWAYWSMVY